MWNTLWQMTTLLTYSIKSPLFLSLSVLALNSYPQVTRRNLNVHKTFRVSSKSFMYWCFPVNFVKFLRTPFLHKAPMVAASVNHVVVLVQ